MRGGVTVRAAAARVVCGWQYERPCDSEGDSTTSAQPGGCRKPDTCAHQV